MNGMPVDNFFHELSKKCTSQIIKLTTHFRKPSAYKFTTRIKKLTSTLE